MVPWGIRVQLVYGLSLFSGTSDKPTSAARIVYCLKIAEAGSEPSSTTFITWWSLAERWKTGVKMALAAVHFHGFRVARQGPWITSVNKGKKRRTGASQSERLFVMDVHRIA